ncbi:HNH endonuclease [Mycolicibacterium gilvum]|uniref:HNH endonuclease n=1 Tax=Mycolicibacterium gilvum (strain DSM 45189 / LMG 24558 / Spyr1) TaxID=278137 RepID=E6TED6_MYCSR|nr:HNH endonuclease [Mycolicibacterium gilvum]ADT97653.1 HNH endonuclease [Mycolicibacterium gilvum Spyr1]MCV7055806.1 HNH endonuclease [Mycolicibacterium gilvum]
MARACRGCGAELQKRQQKVFCGNACQQAYQRRLLLGAWLETGVCRGGMSHQRHYVRVYLNDQQGGCCAICGLKNLWNGLTLGLVIDHIDGDPKNDRRENLRLICPNCDSQLPTYKAKNWGKGRYNRRQRYADGQSY